VREQVCGHTAFCATGLVAASRRATGPASASRLVRRPDSVTGCRPHPAATASSTA